MEVYIIFLIIIDGVLAILPANVAKRKGKDFTTWYVYGLFLWIIAMLHAISLPEKNIYDKGNDIENLDYKVINKGSLESTIDLNSPVEILKWNIVSINNNEYYFNISFRNLNQGIISAVKLEIQGFNSFNEIVKVDGEDAFECYIQDLDVQLGCEFENIVPILLPKNDIRNLDITIKEISFNSGKFIYKNRPNKIDLEVEYITEDDELNTLKTYAHKAMCYAEEKNNLWICVCGRPNYESSKKCVRCGLEKDYVFSSLSKERILNETDKRKKIEAEEEKDRLLKQQQLEEKTRKTRKIKIIFASIISIVFICIVVEASNINNYKKTALTYFVKQENMKKIEKAIKLGANVNVVDGNGQIPLNVAIEQKNIEIVKKLIKHGADVNKKDKNGKSPFEIATDLKETKISDILIKNGADGFKEEKIKLTISDGIDRDYYKECFNVSSNNKINIDSVARTYYEKQKKAKIQYYFSINKKLYMYEGEIENNTLNGKGILYNKFAESSGRFAKYYDGSFKDGGFSGTGAIYWPLHCTGGYEKIQIQATFENGNINGEYKLFKEDGAEDENGICYNGIIASSNEMSSEKSDINESTNVSSNINENNIKISREEAMNIVNTNLGEYMYIAKEGTISSNSFVVDENVYGHLGYFILGKGGNSILYVLDANTGSIYSAGLKMDDWRQPLKLYK